VFVAQVRAARSDAERALTQALRAADPALPTPRVFPLDEVVARSLARERFGATLLSVLAALALVLTALGIHGVLAYTVQQRRREIGIRMALGARASDLVGLVVRQGLGLAAGGLALGLSGAFGFTRFLSSQLFGVAPTDPATFAAVATLLAIVALAATVAPAHRAASVDPVVTLRSE
jgi:putative ABC transport system permease protein